MKFQASLFAVPATLATVLFLVNCGSSDEPGTPGTAGAPATGGSSSGTAGKAGSAGSGVSGAGAGGAAAGAGGAAGSAGSGVSGGGAAGGSVGAAGSAGSGTAGGSTFEASFATVKAVIETTSCLGSGCHGGEGNRLEMKVDDKLYGTLTTHVTLNCGKLINTASPADSAFIKVLQGDCGTPPNVTPRMPQDKCFQGDVDTESCVNPGKIAAIQAWIAKGAPQQ